MRRLTLLVVGAFLVTLLAGSGPVSAQADDPPAPAPEAPVDDPVVDGDAPAPRPLDPDEIPDAGNRQDDGSGDVDHEVIVGSAELAEDRLVELEGDLSAAEALVADLRKRIELLDTFEVDLTLRRQRTIGALARTRTRRVERAVGAYVRGGPPGLEQGLLAGSNGEAEEAELIGSVLQADEREVGRLLTRRLELTAGLSRVAEERSSTVVRLRRARRAVTAAADAVDTGEYAAQIFAAGGEIAITGFVFPVGDPHDFIDSWGFPRPGGNRHEGADIFAARGTPLFAVEDGVLARVGNDRRGGTKLWLVGESGTHYYYAHLERYALGVADGVTVEAGDVVGYVGDSGDAKGTPPHLHFQLHPGGGSAVNPFPLLSVVDQLASTRRST